MKRLMIAALIATCGCLGFVPTAQAGDEPRKPSIQIALLLDTSNSMDGLIDQARTQLWSVVNEFIRAKKDGRAPLLQVALYEYGNDNLPRSEGFVRLVVPMTDDLDTVSEKLFALKTKGGEEYCGEVIHKAITQLDWSTSGEVYKAIFIAGNEAFSQGEYDYGKACREAIQKGILVNTIFCGPTAEGEQTGWKNGAVLADGRYMNIDQDQKIVSIPTPQDKQIAKLGTDLNQTYLAFGKMGRQGLLRQTAQDGNASNASQSAVVARSISKSCPDVYCNDAWDLVDAIKNGKAKLDELTDDELPESMRKMTKAERVACVNEQKTKRETLQKEIASLSREREKFLSAERKKQAEAGQKETLDTVILKAVREQAARVKIRFE